MILSKTHHEIWSLRLSVEDMQDYLLVDEVSMICEDVFIDKIIYSFITLGVLLEKEREHLIWYYVLYNCEEYVDV